MKTLLLCLTLSSFTVAMDEPSWPSEEGASDPNELYGGINAIQGHQYLGFFTIALRSYEMSDTKENEQYLYSTLESIFAKSGDLDEATRVAFLDTLKNQTLAKARILLQADEKKKKLTSHECDRVVAFFKLAHVINAQKSDVMIPRELQIVSRDRNTLLEQLRVLSYGQYEEKEREGRERIQSREPDRILQHILAFLQERQDNITWYQKGINDSLACLESSYQKKGPELTEAFYYGQLSVFLSELTCSCNWETTCLSSACDCVKTINKLSRWIWDQQEAIPDHQLVRDIASFGATVCSVLIEKISTPSDKKTVSDYLEQFTIDAKAIFTQADSFKADSVERIESQIALFQLAKELYDELVALYNSLIEKIDDQDAIEGRAAAKSMIAEIEGKIRHRQKLKKML